MPDQLEDLKPEDIIIKGQETAESEGVNTEEDEDQSEENTSENTTEDENNDDAGSRNDDEDEDGSEEGGSSDNDTATVEDGSGKDGDDDGSSQEPPAVDNEILSRIEQVTGVKLSSKESVTDFIDKVKASAFEGLSDAIVQAIEWEKSGGNATDYFSVASQNFETMTDKDVLLHKFMQENKEVFAENPELGKRRFERYYSKQYGILSKKFEDDEERNEWLAEDDNQEDYDFAKSELEHEVKMARKSLKKWQEDALKSPATQEKQPTQEELDAIKEKFQNQVKTAVSNYKGVSIDVNGKEFKYLPKQENLDKVNQILQDPFGWIKDVLGISEEGIDVDKLLPFVVEQSDKSLITKLMTQFAVENTDEDTLKALLNPEVNSSTDGGSSAKNLEEQIAEAFEKKRNI